MAEEPPPCPGAQWKLLPSRTHTLSAGAILRFILIALTAFLTVVDLFATQAILPSLARH